MWDALWRNGRVATMTAGAPFGLIEAGAVAAEGGRIAWVRAESALPAGYRGRHDLSAFDYLSRA
jgi:imidazolonepropionase